MRATTLTIMVCVCLLANPVEAKNRRIGRRHKHQKNSAMQGDQGANLRLDNGQYFEGPPAESDYQPPNAERGSRRAAGSDGGVSVSNTEARVIAAVNKYRDGYGLAPLKADSALMRVGRNAAPYFSHVINGKWCWTRANEAGFPGWATDDIAEGYESPEDAVQGWATSDGHAHQMRGDFNMNGAWRNYHFNRIGVGISGRKYIAVFGRRD